MLVMRYNVKHTNSNVEYENTDLVFLNCSLKDHCVPLCKPLLSLNLKKVQRILLQFHFTHTNKKRNNKIFRRKMKTSFPRKILLKVSIEKQITTIVQLSLQHSMKFYNSERIKTWKQKLIKIARGVCSIPQFISFS